MFCYRFCHPSSHHHHRHLHPLKGCALLFKNNTPLQRGASCLRHWLWDQTRVWGLFVFKGYSGPSCSLWGMYPSHGHGCYSRCTPKILSGTRCNVTINAVNTFPTKALEPGQPAKDASPAGAAPSGTRRTGVRASETAGGTDNGAPQTAALLTSPLNGFLKATAAGRERGGTPAPAGARCHLPASQPPEALPGNQQMLPTPPARVGSLLGTRAGAPGGQRPRVLRVRGACRGLVPWQAASVVEKKVQPERQAGEFI